MKIKFRKHVTTLQPNDNCSADRYQNINHRCKLRINRKIRLGILVALVIFNLIESILGNPVFVDNPSIAQFQSGRNIRHLPCIVRKSGLSGTCMFAIDCIKQNGTHLGTCIDRFYFGSCCQMKEDIPFHAQDISDNSVDQNTISHYIHESSTNVPPTSALFKLTNESLPVEKRESLLKNNSTTIAMQNRETPTKPTKILIELMTTNKPSTKHESTGNYSTILLPESSSPSTLTSAIYLLPLSLHNNDSTTELVSINFNASEISSTQNILSQATFSNGSSLNHSSSSPLLTTAVPLETITAIPDLLKPLHTSTNFVLTTTKSTAKPFKRTTEESKFSTYQIVETTTPSISLVTQSSSYSSTTASLQKLSATTIKPLSKKPTIINSTNKPFTTKRNTTQRTKITRRPIISIKPTVSLTAFSLSSRKPPPTKLQTTTVRIQQSDTTRRTTIPPKRTPIKRPATTSTLRPKPITKRPTTIHISTLPKIDVTNVKNITGKPIQNVTVQMSPATTKTTTKPTTTPLPLVPAATKAPHPKPKPTANIVKVSPTTTTENVAEIISTVPPSSIPVTIKPLLITGKPLTTKPLPTTHQTEKISSTVLSDKTVTPTSPPLSLILNNLSSRPIITEATTTTESTTLKPSGLITWTNIDAPSNNNTDKNDDWIPRPPPDWVLLPTIKPEVEANKTVQIKQNVSTTVDLSNNSEIPPSIVTFTTIEPEIISQLTNLLNQSSTEGLPSLNTENSLSSSTTPATTANINSSTTISTTKSPQIPSLDGLDYKQICGKRMFPEPRIVGGANAAFGRWPWQISLRQWRTSTYLHKCGAALLNENWAITAAHCVDNVPPSDLLLRLGEYDLAEEDEPYSYQERRVQIVASHPQFDPRTFEYDLALLRFYEPVTFQPNIIPICVPDNDYDFLEQTAYVTGWGRLYEDGPLPSVLQEVSVPVINNTICETMYRAAGYIEHIPNIFICAGWKKGGYDSCEGDSGGPMVLQRDDKRFVLGGVISWGIGCAEPNQPGVYTRISEFRDWINQILQF